MPAIQPSSEKKLKVMSLGPATVSDVLKTAWKFDSGPTPAWKPLP